MTKKELRKLLLSRKPEDIGRLAAWSATASDEEQERAYLAVAKASAPSLRWFPLINLFTTLCFLQNHWHEHGFWIWLARTALMTFMVVLVVVAMFGPNWRSEAARIAAAWLAARRKREALLAIAAHWSPFVREDATAQNIVFRDFLTDLPDSPNAAENEALGKMVERSLPVHLRFRQRDFSDSAADVLLTTIGLLAKAPVNNDAIPRRVARFPAPESCPNRRLLRDMAILFVEKPKVSVPLQRPAAVQNAVTAALTMPQSEAQTALLHWKE